MIEHDDPNVLRHVCNGRPVSIDARSIKRDDNELIHVRRHRLVQLQAIAILDPGEVPVYDGAKITRVRPLPARTAAPVGALDLGGYVLREGDEVIDHVRGTVRRYEGGTLVPA